MRPFAPEDTRASKNRLGRGKARPMRLRLNALTSNSPPKGTGRGMEFRILGPLEVYSDGQALDVGGAKQRALLAVLLLDANNVVSRDRLIEALWEDRPPDSAGKALQVYVS